MKSVFLFCVSMVCAVWNGSAQKIEFVSYDLPNGLHVILHQEDKAPVVTVGVMYHVGSKDEEEGRSGFAHFFEHLLFEGTQHIERGKWFTIVSAYGGRNNANTTQDRTYYYETLPSNALAIGLWMESERMLHPIINQIGVDTQNEVVKEEKRQRIDNAPYGKITYKTGIHKYLFEKHPYAKSVIGEMKDLDAAKLEEFIAFKQRYYNPNNAVLVVAGDINISETKALIADYFGTITNQSKAITRTPIIEEPIQTEIKAVEYDANIKVPGKVLAYRTPKQTERDAYVLDYLATVLTGGKSSRLYKSMVEDKKMALHVAAYTSSREDYSTYIMAAFPLGDVSLEALQQEMDVEIAKLQETLISEKEFQKLQNQFESDFVNANASMEGIANSLARYYMLYGDTNIINTEIEIYRSITREDIQRVAKKYLTPNSRLNLEYLPKPTP